MTPRTPSLLRATVLSIGILAAVSFSFEANAEMGNRSGFSRSAATGQWGQNRPANPQWSGRSWGERDGNNSNGEWRGKLKEGNAAAAEARETRAVKQSEWREGMEQRRAAAAEGREARAQKQTEWRERMQQQKTERSAAWQKKFQRGGEGGLTGNTTVTGQGGREWNSSTTHNPATHQTSHTNNLGGWEVTGTGGPSGTRTGTYSTNKGGSGTIEQEYERGGGSSTRNTTVTNQDGKSANWTTEKNVTRDNGTITTSTNVTGQNGNTWNSSTSYNPATHTTSHTGNSGGSWTVTGTGGPSGTRTGTYTGAHGGSGTIEQEYERGGGSSTRNTTVTNQNGQSASWTTQQSVTVNNGTVKTTTNVTPGSVAPGQTGGTVLMTAKIPPMTEEKPAAPATTN